MCGIYCLVHCGNAIAEGEQIHPATHELLVNRGPDAYATHSIRQHSFRIDFAGAVLWQQGNEPCQQPLVNDEYVLLMNGDIYSRRGSADQSDTQWLMDRLVDCRTSEQLVGLFRVIRGPYSIIFYDQVGQNLFFLRDSLGRQTLLLGRRNDGAIIVSSVIAKSDARVETSIELPPLGLFCLNLAAQSLKLYPWTDLSIAGDNLSQLEDVESVSKLDCFVCEPIRPEWLTNCDSLAKDSFNFQSILHDRLEETAESIFNILLENVEIVRTCTRFIELLKNSVQQRIFATPKYCRNCIRSRRLCAHAKIGILFSGGVDCTILACLMDQLLNSDEPIDLINVAFEKVSRQKVNVLTYETPDRIAARNSLEQLRLLNDKRQWNLIEIDVTRKQLVDAQTDRIRDLVNPLCSILDESLGSVLWFGASGSGISDGVRIHSSSRVLLIGSGADELFGGYTRHRNAFMRPSIDPSLAPYANLENELNFDFLRLPSRNLARDDRVIGDYGITARSPYLEEDFICFSRSLSAPQKCYHALEQGVGDKLILRLCAHLLGLQNVSSLRKRAMQFGSRIADPKQNARDISIALC